MNKQSKVVDIQALSSEESSQNISHLLKGQILLGSDELQSQQAVTFQKLNWKRKLMLNNIGFSIVLNLMIAILLSIAVCLPRWYSRITDEKIIHIGLMYVSFKNQIRTECEGIQCKHTQIARQPNLTLGIITVFFLFIGVVQQIWFAFMQIQFILRCKPYKINDGKKPVRFKTMAKTIFYSHITALLFWLIMSILSEGGLKLLGGQFGIQPEQTFYISIGIVLGFLPVYWYFALIKEKLRQNSVMMQLLQQE